MKITIAALLFLVSSSSLLAQDAMVAESSSPWNPAMILIVAIIIGLGAMLVYLVVMSNQLTKQLRETKIKSNDADAPKSTVTWLDLFRRDERDTQDKLIEGHNYDNIQEYDNNPPSWFNWLFYISIVFAVVYMFYYHLLGIGPDQEERYENQIAEAREKYGDLERKVDYSTLEPYTEEAQIQMGQEIYQNYCSSCHGKQGEGLSGLGPNLTDEYWLHGGSFQDIYKTINEGVVEKGMAAWNEVLPQEEIKQVASFVNTLRNTNPPNQKEPQGEPYDGNKTASAF